NPLEQSGTFPLPESQLDRFLMRISLGYPSDEFEKALLKRTNIGKDKKLHAAIFDQQEFAALTSAVEEIHVSDAIIDYLQSLVSQTRGNNSFITGLSPRAGLQWLQAAKALAFIDKRDAVLPEDIKQLAPYTAAHRLHCNDGADTNSELTKIIDATEVL
ncbi:MAG: MoxR family ATPase, partial [Acidiferrobacterales bacterium]|nr:MoxR family ATPase [Acidiferrobacterales bacterium]